MNFNANRAQAFLDALQPLSQAGKLGTAGCIAAAGLTIAAAIVLASAELCEAIRERKSNP